ncbi:MAG: SMP-30/gluconolactonase/LRE family protein [Actinomycetota bacterium]|nr:SMP-30/gluconolactonase/LRE family protein [Actinomycetota bacterium]
MSVEVLADGLRFGESPRWRGGELWFSDFYDHEVKTVDLHGRIASRLTVAGRPSGLGWLPDGRLLVVSMTDRLLLREQGGALVMHADLSGIATFDCNDMVVDAAGRAYVGNFGIDMAAASAEVGFRAALAAYAGATLARVDPDGTVTAAAAGLKFPNGSVITPDGRTLIVAESFGRCLTAFDIDAHGALSNRRVWADLAPYAPDGICLDASGAVWVADMTGPRCLRVREGGEVLQVVATEQPCFACALGGDDGHTLFMMTAESSEAPGPQAARTGRVVTSRVAAGHAGRP